MKVVVYVKVPSWEQDEDVQRKSIVEFVNKREYQGWLDGMSIRERRV